MPASRSAAIAGAMISISSRPICPASPACGLSPLKTIRGAARPKRRLKSASTISPVSISNSRVMRRGTCASGTWIVAGTTASVGRPEQHHRPRFLAIEARSQFAEEFGMAGMGKARPLQDFLGDGIGDERIGHAGVDELDSRFRSRRRSRRRRQHRARPELQQLCPADRRPAARAEKAPAPRRCPPPRRGHSSRSAARGPRDDRRSAMMKKTGAVGVRVQGRPGLQRQFRADAGRIAARQRHKAARRRHQCLTMTA